MLQPVLQPQQMLPIHPLCVEISICPHVVTSRVTHPLHHRKSLTQRSKEATIQRDSLNRYPDTLPFEKQPWLQGLRLQPPLISLLPC